MTQDHDCRDHLLDRPDDPILPPHISLTECAKCGAWFEYDETDDSYAPAE